MDNSVTVLLPVYNGQPFLADSIQSIIQQKHSNLELLIIDDGSTDDSVSLITQYKDSRIRLIRHDKNQGLISTLNQGIAEAQYALIARHDQDDIAYPERLQQQVDFMVNHREVGVCGSGAYILENELRTKKIIFPASDALIRWALPFYNPLIHPSIMYRRSLVLKVSGYSTAAEANYNEDYDLWWRLLPHTKFHNIPRPLLDLRKHQTNMTVAKKDYHIEQTTKITEKYLNELLNDSISLDLIRCLRGFQTKSSHKRDSVKLMYKLCQKYIFRNECPLIDRGKITANVVIRMLKAIFL